MQDKVKLTLHKGSKNVRLQIQYIFLLHPGSKIKKIKQPKSICRVSLHFLPPQIWEPGGKTPKIPRECWAGQLREPIQSWGSVFSSPDVTISSQPCWRNTFVLYWFDLVDFLHLDGWWADFCGSLSRLNWDVQIKLWLFESPPWPKGTAWAGNSPCPEAGVWQFHHLEITEMISW